MAGFPYWIVPIFSSVVWLAMLLAMVLTWIVDGRPQLASMDPGQSWPYISDIGAWKLKPLFIAMGTVAVVSFDVAFVLERWFRHLGKLTPNTSWWQKTYSLISIITAIAGAVGLILLTIFDTLRHPKMHDAMLGLFIIGYVISAIAICAEYQRLGIHYREYRILRISFWIKLTFIIVEIGLAIGFGVTRDLNTRAGTTAAIIEWVVALVFTFYVMSFALDFLPVRHTSEAYGGKDRHSMDTEEMAMRDPSFQHNGSREQYTGGALPYQHQTTIGYPHTTQTTTTTQTRMYA